MHGMFLGANIHNANMAISGGGLADSIAAEPTVNASAAVWSSVTQTTATISWTPGDGTYTLVGVYEGASTQLSPVDEVTYAVDTVFGGGDGIAETSSSYGVYKSTGSTVNITGLTAGKTYGVMLASFNSNGDGTENYMGWTTPVETSTLTAAVWHSLLTWDISTPISGINVDWSAYAGVYDCFEVRVTNLVPGTDNNNLRYYPIISGSPVSTNMDMHLMTSKSTSAGYAAFAYDANALSIISNSAGSDTGESGSMVLRFYEPANASYYKCANVSGAAITTAADVSLGEGGYLYEGAASAIDGVRLYMGSGNIGSATVTLLGRNEV